MGKQSENKLAGGCIIIVIVLAIIWLAFAFATVILPIVVLTLFLVNWIRYMVQDRKRRATNFWLSAQEQEQFEKAANMIAYAEDEREKVQNLVTVRGISRNQDGQISQRSYEGKDLRGRENTANSLIDKYTPIYSELQSRPYNRWRKARSHYAKAFGFGVIILVVAALFGISELRDVSENKSSDSTLVSETGDSTKIVSSEVTEQNEKVELSEQTAKSTDDSTENSNLESFIKALLSLFGMSIGIMAGLLAAVAILWLIGWLIGRIRFGLKNPEPPLVSMNNVDTYVEKYMEKLVQKEAERKQREENLRQKREQKRIAKEQAKTEKIRVAEKNTEETETQKVEDKKPDVQTPEPETLVIEPNPVTNEVSQRSKEENMFMSWADTLRESGYDIIGNWENWANAGQWKNLAVVSSINDVPVRIIIEYYAKSRKIYFGIAKFSDKDKLSQELLDSDAFQKIISDCGLTVKSTGWWYCMKYSSFDNIFQEYQQLIEKIIKK